MRYDKSAVVPAAVQTVSQTGTVERGVFYVGGEYVPHGNDCIMAGQIYVEVYVPETILHRYPLVLIHGNAQTGSIFLQTLEGKAGWLNDFIRQGFVVYIVDQPERGRSICHSDINGARISWPAKATADLFCRSQGYPLAERHTQWPGGGEPGDPVFDNFYMSQVDSLNDPAAAQRLMRKAGAALLDKIGPAILICHSQAGPFAWILADARPGLVKAAVAIEPSGPPFVDVRTGEALLDEDGRPVNYGISFVPLAFDPPCYSPAQIQLARHTSDIPGRQNGFLQREPARQLPHLANTPILILTAQASYHTPFDYLTAEFLRQAGVPAEYVELEEVGILGNGHMMMLEKNSGAIADWIAGWLSSKNY